MVIYIILNVFICSDVLNLSVIFHKAPGDLVWNDIIANTVLRTLSLKSL